MNLEPNESEDPGFFFCGTTRRDAGQQFLEAGLVCLASRSDLGQSYLREWLVEISLRYCGSLSIFTLQPLLTSNGTMTTISITESLIPDLKGKVALITGSSPSSSSHIIYLQCNCNNTQRSLLSVDN